MELWISTPKTILAAALGTLGVPVRMERALDDLSGRALKQFHLGTTCLSGRIQTNSLKLSFESGDLLREHPDHPILDICYSKQNRDRLLDAVNKGVRIEFVDQDRAEGSRAQPRTFYQRGGACSFPGKVGCNAVLKTPDLNIVAALSRFGVPVLEVEGPQGNRQFILDANARLVGCGPLGETSLEVVKAWRAGELSAEHPFSYAVLGLVNYGKLVRSIRTETEQVLIRKPHSLKSAIIDPNTTGKGMDKMRRFFLG